ncbi:MAG: phosphoglucosamine mutase [Clostridia bacterium]|nr:phosphoglucosamine mutase [Clostridia bacterium]
MGKLFGTDGVRGVANSELTVELAFKLGQAGAFVLTEESHNKPKILIGKDTRISGDMLEAALCAGLCSVGAEVILAGVVPTPAIAYLTRYYNADAGIVISASHNPMEYNGIKFFNSKGFKLSDEIENEIEEIILEKPEKIKLAKGADIGRIVHKKSAVDDYKAFAKSTITTDFKGMKIAIDCANGASSFTSRSVLEELGAEVYVINDQPDGVNINKDCGSTHIDQLCGYVKQVGADIGLAFDGDADRVLAVDENGVLVDGDKIMSICALDMRARGKLNDDVIVVTVMSNLGLFIMAKEQGLNIKKTIVGDRYVLEEMCRGNYSIGGEQSGHIIFLEHNTTGDGLVTALQLLSVVKYSCKKVSELASVMEVLPQVLINAKVKTENKKKYTEDAEIVAEIEKIEAEFNGNGRVLIRPSGTEPLVRVMIEGKDTELITKRAESLAKLIESKLG